MSSRDTSTLLLFFVVGLAAVCGDELLAKQDESIDRGAHSDRSGLWFGPRLGKRSPPPVEDERDILQRLLEAAANLKYETDVYEQETQNDGDKRKLWSKHGRSEKHRPEPRRRYNPYNDVDFTPRLGRSVADSLSDEELARYFTLRVNRQPDFTPRLGRSASGYPESVRVARSVNKTKS